MSEQTSPVISASQIVQALKVVDKVFPRPVRPNFQGRNSLGLAPYSDALEVMVWFTAPTTFEVRCRMIEIGDADGSTLEENLRAARAHLIKAGLMVDIW